MKLKTIVSLLAVIHFLALMQMGVSWVASAYWRAGAGDTDLPSVVEQGGKHAVARVRRSQERVAMRVRHWGVGLAGAVFVTAAVGTVFCRREQRATRRRHGEGG